ncbi:flagellar basal body P-ring formation chaperone FlgA [Nevskia soli]|jgi:flagella basal body P-ring formation protein FlgA|uniref:flagellar basal body P-ring formation chaperone FlgA n=1 Tax=Nevskia soli TaxID=418856 RepID=UPI0015D7EB9C|nr:flagellar basal body P-ring formation chaperone FlgA [Nevskia soli]
MWLAIMAAAGLHTGLHTCTPVDGPRITMRDLARADSRFASRFGAGDPAVEIGFSPEPGSRRTFFPAELLRIAKGAGVDLDVPREAPFQPVCFERRSRVLKVEDLLPAIRAWAPDSAVIEIAEWGRTAVPEGQIVVPSPSVASRNSKEPMLLHGYVVFDGHRHAPVWVRARITVKREVLVAKETIDPGTHTTPAHFQTETRDLVNDWNAPEITMDQVIGKVAKRRIAEGSAVALIDLKTPLPVEPGSGVTVEVREGATRLEFDAKAETGGRIGEMVMIRNASSGKLFSACVTGESTVLVTPRGMSRRARND